MPPSQSSLRSLVRTGLSRSALSLFIKVGTAGLTYLTYVILSRTMGADAYGYFAAGLSLATVLSIGACMGQQTAILRYWPEHEGNGRADLARAALGGGGALVIVAALLLGALVALGAGVIGIVAPQPVLHLVAAAVLLIPMALSEYWSSALRAQGSVLTALAPRDLGWRFATPVVVVLLAMAGVSLSGADALLITALLLAAALALQAWLSVRRHYRLAPDFKALRPYWQRHGAPSRWFLLGTVVDSAALNLDTIFIGLMVAPVAAGVYFNAFRTAGLLTLFTFAITLVVAPMLSKHYHSGEMRKAQAITALCAWAGFGFSLAIFLGFVIFGGPILSLFGQDDASGPLILVLLAFGLLVEAATGPARIVMMMTGHERDYVRLFGLIVTIGLVVEIAVIPWGGIVAAAAVNGLARAVAQVALTLRCRRSIGIDPSLFGLFRVRHLADRPVPAPL
jgi:O-antigen/teichoic acid export membrane protein